MSKGFNLLRVEYLFTVITPLLLAIYLNSYNITNHVDIIAAFGFWAITGNTINDLMDMNDPNESETLKRVKDYSKKEIGVLAISSFLLGCALFIEPVLRHLELIVYLGLTAVLVILYCVALKPYLVINWIILDFSHIWLPYLIIKINAGDSSNLLPFLNLPEIMLLLSASILALSSNFIHEVIDNDAITKLSPLGQQIILWGSSILGIGLSIVSVFMFPEYFIFFFPFMIFPFAVIYMSRSRNRLPHGATTIKDIGIIVGNLSMVFLIVLIIKP
ncbi:MAG: hypothetical protein GF317_18645 [Candidatus Lokiarchaeota archaeon]|nr:hypothetical protein [Candidatus Lokiarchaeota archaeon]MBD3201536.1 hypothetical protein [Candidatus Lokiarchaeota archaeon]